MWLHGPAGGGKTAIGRTIAKWCEEEGILLGEFFFSRADGTGAKLASLAPTLYSGLSDGRSYASRCKRGDI